MARKKANDFEVLMPGLDPAPRRARPRTWLAATMSTVFIFGCVLAIQYTEQFLIRDSRFVLAAPEAGEDSPDLHVEGVSAASRAQILRVFDNDYGRSIYLLSAAERRRNLLAVAWVKDATVSRIWPNQVAVNIMERRPVAFVQLGAGNGASRFALIDADGVILEPQSKARYTLPVLTGIGSDQSEATRRDRVHRMLRLLHDLGKLADQVSEIDVTDPENLRITEQVDNRAIVLVIGNQHYLRRLENFLSHYGDIRRRLPDANVLDLRLEDRITAVRGAQRD